MLKFQLIPAPLSREVRPQAHRVQETHLRGDAGPHRAEVVLIIVVAAR